jgi:hypothetical protein
MREAKFFSFFFAKVFQRLPHERTKLIGYEARERGFFKEP